MCPASQLSFPFDWNNDICIQLSLCRFSVLGHAPYRRHLESLPHLLFHASNLVPSCNGIDNLRLSFMILAER